MEIMVVIIVIAVLASVAGPMIGSITDQGKAAATRASMQNIKTALVNFNNDLGKFPHTGTVYAGTAARTAINSACTEYLGDTLDKNILVELNTAAGDSNMGISAFAKRWKGPYMDSEPAEFMTDAWESKIRYSYSQKAIYLHSWGPDGGNDYDATDLNVGNEDTDDIVMSVSRVKF